VTASVCPLNACTSLNDEPRHWRMVVSLEPENTARCRDDHTTRCTALLWFVYLSPAALLRQLYPTIVLSTEQLNTSPSVSVTAKLVTLSVCSGATG